MATVAMVAVDPNPFVSWDGFVRIPKSVVCEWLARRAAGASFLLNISRMRFCFPWEVGHELEVPTSQ